MYNYSVVLPSANVSKLCAIRKQSKSMKKKLSLLLAILMLFAVACTEIGES